MQSTNTSQEALRKIQESFLSRQNVKIHPQGTSMLPLLLEGRDSVIVSSCENHKFHTGDLLLYQRDTGLLVLHRLCAIKKDGFYFVGDNQTDVEGPIAKEQIIAVTTKITRNNRTFNANNIIYVLYSKVLLLLRPIRPYVVKIIKKFWKESAP